MDICNRDTNLYPLTHPQKRIWYIEKIYSNTSLNNIGGPIRIKGEVDFNILESCINILIKKNEGLRLRLIEDDGEVMQYVRDYEEIELDFIDFSQYNNPQDEFNKWVVKEAGKPFTLENERLFYFALFKISDTDNGYFAKFHHIICDGWSINIMTEEICNNYMKLISGEEVDDSKKHSYIEYIANENSYLSSERFLKNKSFWKDTFKVIPDSFLNRSSHLLEGRRKTYELDMEVCSKLKRLTADRKCSLNTFFVMLYLVYLYKVTQQEDIVIGTPVLNRSGVKEKSMFGMFTSTMPFRFTVMDNSDVLDNMNMVNEGLKKCFFNQKYPYDILVKDLELKKNGFDSLFNICVNYYNTKLNSDLNGSPIENVEFYNGNQMYSLQMVVKDWSDSGNLTLEFDYKINDYSDEDIEQMYNQLLNLINQILTNPSRMVRDISLVSNDEKTRLLYEFNDTHEEYPSNKMIYELFEEQVERVPHKVAISFNNTEVTYKELNEKANQLARYLVEKGVEEETIIGLLTIHSIETVIGILAIIKAGGVYVPIDLCYPNDRINYMLEDSACKLLLTNLELSDKVEFNGEIINIRNANLYVGDASNLEVINKPKDLVYVIYTSGSTGRPKGTLIEHQGLVNYICWAKKLYVKDRDEVFPLYSSLAFDLTVTSIFTPLISGCRIIVYNPNNDDEEYVLYRIMRENKATVIKLTPSHLSLLKDMDNRNSSVRRFIVGGEDFKTRLAGDIYSSFNGNIEIYNEYGPTETVVGCMIHKYDAIKDTRISVPIGTPADNVQIYILDKNLDVVPANTAGELYISGDGVARGYLNRPDLTMERFMDNPFVPGRRMYRTGDLSRFLNNGIIEYVGRADQQVKIRGYRIELGEIEKYLLGHEAVKDALVIDLKDKSNAGFLCAYIVKKFEINSHELKDYLSNYLPDYMIPAHFIELDTISLNRHGKVNRELLPKPVESINNTDCFDYRNVKEENLVHTICNVLNIEKVSVGQNFYHLGGDSIKAIQIASRLNDKGFKIKVKDILSNPIIEQMALCIEHTRESAIPQEASYGGIISPPIISWFFSQEFVNSSHYNQSIVLELEQAIETQSLELILNELIRHHDALRINYDSKTGDLYYNNEHLDNRHIVQEHDLTELTNTELLDRMTIVADSIKASFNIEKDVLIKACIFKLGPTKNKLLITAHHLVIDGVSWRILLEDINAMLLQINARQQLRSPSKTHSYQEWAKVLINYCKHEADNEKSYWEQILAKNFSFPADYDLGEDTIENRETLTVQLDEDVTNQLLTRANISYNTEPKDLLITSLVRTLKEHTGSEELVIELEGHGRNEIFDNIDLSRTVGWFTCLYPFSITLTRDDLSYQIKAVKEEIRGIPNKGVGFGIYRYLLMAIKENIQKYVRFNYLGDFTTGHENSPVKLLEEQLGSDSDKRNHLTYIIEVNSFIISGKLCVQWSYSLNMFSRNTMEKLLNDYVMNLKEIINHCSDKESVEFTPSDFDTVDLSQGELEGLFN